VLPKTCFSAISDMEMAMNEQTSPMTTASPKKRNSTKSLRTREHLKCVARKLFEREGHGGVTAQSVSSAAEFAYGTFYKYYKNKDALLFEICSDYFENLLSGIAQAYEGDTPFNRIFSSQHYYISEVIDNWRFHRSFLAYSLDNCEMGDLIHEARVKEAQRTAAELARLWQASGGPEAKFSTDRTMMTAMALNGMTEGYLQDMLRPSTDGTAKTAMEIKAIAFELSRIFYRGAFLEEPDVNISQPS
jgi:AcrR family transcriptional regulator